MCQRLCKATEGCHAGHGKHLRLRTIRLVVSCCSKNGKRVPTLALLHTSTVLHSPEICVYPRDKSYLQMVEHMYIPWAYAVEPFSVFVHRPARVPWCSELFRDRLCFHCRLMYGTAAAQNPQRRGRNTEQHLYHFKTHATDYEQPLSGSVPPFIVLSATGAFTNAAVSHSTQTLKVTQGDAHKRTQYSYSAGEVRGEILLHRPPSLLSQCTERTTCTWHCCCTDDVARNKNKCSVTVFHCKQRFFIIQLSFFNC